MNYTWLHLGRKYLRYSDYGWWMNVALCAGMNWLIGYASNQHILLCLRNTSPSLVCESHCRTCTCAEHLVHTFSFTLVHCPLKSHMLLSSVSSINVDVCRVLGLGFKQSVLAWLWTVYSAWRWDRNLETCISNEMVFELIDNSLRGS